MFFEYSNDYHQIFGSIIENLSKANCMCHFQVWFSKMTIIPTSFYALLSQPRDYYKMGQVQSIKGQKFIVVCLL